MTKKPRMARRQREGYAAADIPTTASTPAPEESVLSVLGELELLIDRVAGGAVLANRSPDGLMD